jgi:hypothetical protein
MVTGSPVSTTRSRSSGTACIRRNKGRATEPVSIVVRSRPPSPVSITAAKGAPPAARPRRRSPASRAATVPGRARTVARGHTAPPSRQRIGRTAPATSSTATTARTAPRHQDRGEARQIRPYGALGRHRCFERVLLGEHAGALLPHGGRL